MLDHYFFTLKLFVEYSRPPIWEHKAELSVKAMVKRNREILLDVISG